jgi:hypothetical protein
MAHQGPSTVRSAAFRRSALSFEKAIPMGGERKPNGPVHRCVAASLVAAATASTAACAFGVRALDVE